MRPLTLVFAARIFAASAVTLPVAAAAIESPYCTAQPVSDEVLDTMSATALLGFARALARSLSDGNSQLFLQQVGVGSRIAVDNWWSQTGAVLIYNNIIAPTAFR